MTDSRTDKQVLILGFLGLGDMVQFSPCFRIIREGIPDAKIVLMTLFGSVAEIFRQSPYIDEVVHIDLEHASLFNKLRMISLLRKRRFDISILPYPSYRREENIISMLVNAKHRYSFDFHKGRFTHFSFLNNHLVDANYDIHNVENNLTLMRELGFRTEKKEEYHVPIRFSETFMKEFFRHGGVSDGDFKIGIHPGSGIRAEGKRLEISKFAQISDYLAEKHNAKVLVFFGPEEKSLKDEFVASCKYRHTIVEDLPLNDISQLISRCQLFVVNDSGLMHIASAVGVPTVSIFGPTSYKALHPWRVPYDIVTLGLECSPCYDFTEYRSLKEPLIICKIEDKFACIKRIQAGNVLDRIEKMIRLLYPERILS